MRVGSVVCAVVGHKRHHDPPSYWHSRERCVRCKQLVESPMAAPRIWGKP